MQRGVPQRRKIALRLWFFAPQRRVKRAEHDVELAQRHGI
jgi:hypothetical protein